MPPPEAPDERRQAPRVGVEAKVRLHGDKPWSGVYNTADLSSTGAFLVSESPPPRGSMVTLDLELGADEDDLQGLSALVVHVRTEASEASARGCGVMFLRLDRENAERLQTIVENRLRS